MFWRGVWGYLPANIIQGVTGFLAIMVFTRLLSAEDFGRYALAYSVMTLAHVAVFTWLEASMARFWAAQSDATSLESHFGSLYRAAFTLMAVYVPVVGLAIWLAPWELPFKLAVAAGLMGSPIRCLAKLAQERFRAAGEVSRAAGLDIYVALTGFGVGALFAWAGAGGASPLLGLAIAPLFALPFILPGELRQARRAPADPARLREYAAYGYPIAASLALALVLSSTDRFLLALFMNEAAVGAYHASYSIANRTLDVLFIWLGAAGTPALVMALERGGRERLIEAAREQASAFILIALPAAAGVALVARPLAEFMIGEDLRQAAAGVTPIVAFSALLSGLTTYYFHQAFTLGRRTRRLLIAMSVPAIANVILNALLIPHFGVAGAAWATLISFGVGLLGSIALGRAAMPLPMPWKALVRCGVATGAMAAVVWMLPPIGGFPEVMMDAAIGGAVYGVAALLLNAAGVRDVARRLLKSFRARLATA
ncbi:polysaccharide biosynthesis protein [Brevundimonas sp. Leaf363]|uniref:lipopolysaccharide biosynthesis protein n=1 Tax=Brevundimonas sp. Leaf363 TaxID=1736353 RepID=UPI0006F55172|nr:lipopolysaccharide biosynthesis protein [Brevundimonas sp. Leaf363]KQS55863.1 polysaccharide biosynthesis protein [Brevundimonas sp. Leaf363]